MTTKPSITARIKAEYHYYRALIADNRTPRIAKWCLGAALAYLVMPFDLIPDFIPILGQLDDVIIVGGLVWLGLKLIPAAIKSSVRAEIQDIKKRKLR